jgi:endonuclease YncB( thermonuclease family)
MEALSALHACTDKNTKKFGITGRYTAKSLSVYDGDTITIALCPFQTDIWKFKVRMMHYNSAELKSKNPDEKKKALEAKQFLQSQILDKIIEIDITGTDKYGRLLGVVYCDGCNINQLMLDRGYGRPYNGTGPKEY